MITNGLVVRKDAIRKEIQNAADKETFFVQTQRRHLKSEHKKTAVEAKYWSRLSEWLGRNRAQQPNRTRICNWRECTSAPCSNR